MKIENQRAKRKTSSYDSFPRNFDGEIVESYDLSDQGVNDPLEILIAREEREKREQMEQVLLEAMNKLPERQREALKLKLK